MLCWSNPTETSKNTLKTLFMTKQTQFFDQLAPDRPHINFLADLEQDRTDT